MLIGLAIVPFVAVPAGPAWPYLLTSAVVHIAYFALLMTSFRLGDFGQAYPIARGSAPLVVTVPAAVFAHEVPGGWAPAGIAVSCVGLIGVSLWGLRGSRPNWAAIGAALATGLTIAGYTVIDGLGVRAAHSPLGYIAWLLAVEGLVIPAYMCARARADTVRLLRPYAALGLIGAALSFAAYALVLWAQTRAELAPIAALRESSVNPRSCVNNFAGQGTGEAISYAVAPSGVVKARLGSTVALTSVGDALNPA